jgi:hypothetical protein
MKDELIPAFVVDCQRCCFERIVITKKDSNETIKTLKSKGWKYGKEDEETIYGWTCPSCSPVLKG